MPKFTTPHLLYYVCHAFIFQAPLVEVPDESVFEHLPQNTGALCYGKSTVCIHCVCVHVQHMIAACCNLLLLYF